MDSFAAPNTTMSTTVTTEVYYDDCDDASRLADFPIFSVAIEINDVYLWVIFAFGFPGNLFSFLTILRMKPRVKSSIYVAALAATDNICLLCKILFSSLTRYNVSLEDEGCRFLQYTGSFTGQLANWILVAMTLERCLGITMPLRSLKFGKRHDFVFIGMIILFLLLVNVPYAITVIQVQTADGGNYCFTDPELLSLDKIMNWVDAAVYALVPAAALVILSLLILRELRKATTVMRDLSLQRQIIQRRERSQRDITITIVLSCIVFILLVTPRPLMSVVLTQWQPCLNTRAAANIEFIGQVFYVLSDSSHAVNFYLYFLSNGRFRRGFALLITEILCKTCCCCCNQLRSKGRAWMRRMAEHSNSFSRSRSQWNVSTTTLQTSQAASESESVNTNSRVQLRKLSTIQHL